MMFGYMGKVLQVDLTARLTWDEPLPENLLRQYLGGAGLGAWYLYRETRRDTDPLGPDNLLILLTGPLVGTKVPTSGRHAVVAESPPGQWGESDSGGTWGQMLKRAGYDGILVAGASDAPVYLWVTETRVEIRPAKHLWGVDTYDVDPLLKAETSSKAVVLAIGPAGERLARLAAVMNDGHDGRAAGRGGLGAVMGSKRLKAIVVFGGKAVPIAHPESLMQAVKRTAPVINERASNLKRMYNARLGQSRKDDVLPQRVLEEQLPDGGAGQYTPPFEAMLRDYYAARGWDGDGLPTTETLRRLGLEWTIPDLPKRNGQ